MIFIYLVALIIAPQLWIYPLIGLRVDLIIYPLWIAIIIASGKIKNNRWLPQDIVLAMFILWIIISTIINGIYEGGGPNQLSSIEIIIDYIKWLLLYKLVALSTSNLKRVQIVVKVMVFLILVIAVESIDQKLSLDGLGWANQPLGWVDISVIEAGGTGRTQWINIFDGPGVFCVLFTLGLPFTFNKLTKSHSNYTRILNMIYSVLLLIAIFFTGSRGGFLATMVIIGITYIIWYRISLIKVIVGTCLLLGIFMLAPSYLTNMNDEEHSASHRVEMWAEGLEMVEQNPIFGIGRGRFSEYTGTLIAHNSAIEIMGEMGFVGLFLWTTLIYMSLKTLYVYQKLVSLGEKEIDFVNALGIAILGYIASSMFVTLEYETFYMLHGLVAGLIIKEPGREYKYTLKDIFIVGVVVIMWYIALKLFVMSYF